MIDHLINWATKSERNLYISIAIMLSPIVPDCSVDGMTHERREPPPWSEEP